MKRILTLTAAACVFTLLSGCALIQSPLSFSASEAPFFESARNRQTENPSGGEYTLFFPDDPVYTYRHSISANETVYVLEIIKTNTTQLRVTNNGETAVICNLYDPDDISNVLMTNTIEPGKSASFSNLISSQTYCFGFQTLEDGTIKVSISG